MWLWIIVILGFAAVVGGALVIAASIGSAQYGKRTNDLGENYERTGTQIYFWTMAPNALEEGEGANETDSI